MKDTLQGPVEVSKVVWEGREVGFKHAEDHTNGQGDQEGLMWSQSCRQTLVVGTSWRWWCREGMVLGRQTRLGCEELHDVLRILNSLLEVKKMLEASSEVD